MREKYWNFYCEIEYKMFYYKKFLAFFKGINWCLSAFLTITALSCITAWGIWNSHPLIWSLLICVAQILQALFPKLPYNDLLCSTEFMISALDPILIDIEISWLEIDVKHYSDKKILKLIKKYESQYSSLVSQFYSGTSLPEIKYCDKKAMESCASYFNTKYTSRKENNNA